MMKYCTIDGCDKVVTNRARMCSMHRARIERTGSLDRTNASGPHECAVADCVKVSVRRSGLCDMHHQRLVRHGDVNATRRAQVADDVSGARHVSTVRGDDLARFFDKIERPLSVFDCWVWLGKPRSNGYPAFQVGGHTVAPYRFAYEHLIGPIPTDDDGECYELDHVCHTTDLSCVGGPRCSHRRCVNPFHLEAVTHAENVRRIQRSARNALSLGGI